MNPLEKDQLTSEKKTPLFDQHVQLKAKIVDFNGWKMPLSYEGVLAEHKTVRHEVGVFDVSHMGEILVSGPQAEVFLQAITINNVSNLKTGQGQYSALCNEQGGMLDDLIVYRLSTDEFFLCVNAGNTEKDFKWLVKHANRFTNLQVTDVSTSWAQLAIQGPASLEAIQAILSPKERGHVSNLAYMGLLALESLGGNALLARTGYTGERGFELYLSPSIAARTWSTLLELNQKINIKPVGLGARDTLRLEACYPLYGNEMDESVSPLEIGIEWAVKFLNRDFIGKDALVRQKEHGLKRSLLAFKLVEPGIARHDMAVWHNDKKIGHVTSGSVLPSVGGSGGLALISTDELETQEILIDIRGSKKRAQIVSKPLYPARIK